MRLNAKVCSSSHFAFSPRSSWRLVTEGRRKKEEGRGRHAVTLSRRHVPIHAPTFGRTARTARTERSNEATRRGFVVAVLSRCKGKVCAGCGHDMDVTTWTPVSPPSCPGSLVLPCPLYPLLSSLVLFLLFIVRKARGEVRTLVNGAAEGVCVACVRAQ